MTRETERVVELAFEVGQKLTHVLSEAIPASAQIHLLNAQREMLTALVLIYEHQMGERRENRDGDRRTARRPSRAKRIRKIDID